MVGDPPPIPLCDIPSRCCSVALLLLYGALDSHPFFPSHVASGRCFLSAAAAGALAGVVSAFAEPSGWCAGAVRDAAGCAGCAPAAPPPPYPPPPSSGAELLKGALGEGGGARGGALGRRMGRGAGLPTTVEIGILRRVGPRHLPTRRTSPTRRAPTPCTTLYDASYIPDASVPDALYDTVRRVVQCLKQHSAPPPSLKQHSAPPPPLS